MRIDPEHPARTAHGGEAAERAERDRVISAQDEGKRTTIGGRRDARRDPLAGLTNLGQETNVLVPESHRFLDDRLDVPLVVNRVPQAREPVLEARVAQGGRAHVDAATALPEVERGADDRDLTCLRRAHRREPTLRRSTTEGRAGVVCPAGGDGRRIATSSGPKARLAHGYTDAPRRGSSAGRAHG